MKVLICLVLVVACVVADQKKCFKDDPNYKEKKLNEVVNGCKPKEGAEKYKCVAEAYELKGEKSTDEFIEAVGTAHGINVVKAAIKACKKEDKEFDFTCFDQQIAAKCGNDE